MDLTKLLLAVLGAPADFALRKWTSRPLSEKQIRRIREEAETRQLAEVLRGQNLFGQARSVRTFWNNCADTQELVLRDIMRVNRDTEYGKKHDFSSVRSVSDFRRLVPVTTWEDYRQDIERMMKGEENILFPGRPTYFYRTSGTTAAAKFIPESAQEAVARKLITSVRYAERILNSSLKGITCVLAMFSRKSDLITECGIPAGNSSGRTAGAAGGWVGRHYAYTPQLVEELEGEALYYTMMRLALVHDDVGVISANNARTLAMLAATAKDNAQSILTDIRGGTNRYPLSENIRALEKESLKPNPKRAQELAQLLEQDRFIPRYYWKHLRTACFWLGGSVGVFVDEVRPLLPENVTFMDVGYGASEAKINIPNKPGTPAGPLSVCTGFFEFLPEEGGEPLLAHELEDGRTYEILLTTYAGLYRYRIEDYVRVEGFTGTTPNICFLTKASDVANLVEEKIAGALLSKAVREAAEESGEGYRLCQVYPDIGTTRYVICIETERNPGDVQAFAEMLDRALCEKIAIYEVERHGERMLNPCEVRLMKAGWADHVTEQAAKGRASSAQVKVPVVLKSMPDEEWML